MTLQALKAAVVAGDAAAAEATIAAARESDALLEALVSALSPSTGIPWQLAWRVKRDDLPAALHAAGHVIARFWDRPAIDPIRDRAYTLIAPREWVADARLRAGFVDHALAVELAPGRSTGLVRVPAGRFAMGTSENEIAGGYREAADQRDVAITRDYWLGATVVTRAEWAAVMTPADPTDDDRPAIVGWRDALAFLNALSRAAGLPESYVLDDPACAGFAGPSAPGYRLATDAEWERAARAGTTTATYNGDLKNHYGKNAALDPIAWYGGPDVPAPSVARKLPNAYGLYDMLGLAWEFVFDRYTALPDGPLRDPIGDINPLPPGGRDARVQRGGAIDNFASLCRASMRLDGLEGSFRICRTASEPRADVALHVPEVHTPARANAFIELPHGRPQRLRAHRDRIFVGTEGGLTAPRLHELIVLDANATVLHRWPTRALVSDLAVCGERVWISLGGGSVDASDKLGATPPREELRFVNAPALSTVDDELVVGERFGQVHVAGRHIGGVEQWLYGVAADAERVYAAYEGGKCRVFDRRTGARSRKIPSVGGRRPPLIACAPGVLFVADHDGEISTYDPKKLDRLSSFQTQPLTRIEIQHGQLVAVGPDGVGVFALDGSAVFRWDHSESETTPTDALLFSDHLIVSLAHKKRSEGVLIRVERPR
ncbi:MAG TPA: formylglycine-generating enzyme family protein [Kofleriaceae bacterium]